MNDSFPPFVYPYMSLLARTTESTKSCHGIFGAEVNKDIDIRNRDKAVEIWGIGFDFGALFAGERAYLYVTTFAEYQSSTSLVIK